ncbi:MAG: glycosyltransferase [Ignavibacteria bacterium]|jgi:glycosyltransferase involved in cell wall biosynthesis/predicted SAM-dependent methyltransferase|nr:glycosyltransferase [Ignavibacteria bacterium]
MLNNFSKLTFDTSETPANTQPLNRVGDNTFGFSMRAATGKLVNIMPKTGPIMVNLGCGLDVRDGFINIDLFSDNPNVVNMDIRKLEFADNSVDFILASDVLEHFSHHETDAVLSEWNRVLKPNGTLLIRCPSLRLQIKAYTEKKWNADVASFMIFGGQSNVGDYHCVGFDEASIRHHLGRTGFSVVEFNEVDTPQDKGFINLNMTVKAVKVMKEAFKDVFNVIPPVDVASPIDKCSLNIVWEGSQFVYHSLALVNREVCKNIIDADVANLSIVPYEPDAFDYTINPEYTKLHNNDIRYKPDVSDEIGNLPYAWIRHTWPPKAEAPQGSKWIIMQPWEFGVLPPEFVEIFNRAEELWTPSNYSRQAFINSGIDGDKVQVIPNGINPQLYSPIGEVYPLNTKKKFKFLYVGGTTYRKGFDLLLRAYVSTFKAADNVCLVVKEIGGNTTYKGQGCYDQIMQVKATQGMPEIEYIMDEITDEQMASLYRACDTFVSPYRGEGFSLPTLEAMASGLPVIVTKGGSTDDFTTEETAWYLDSQKISVNSADNLPEDAYLLEVNLEDLMQTLEYVVKKPTINFSQGLIGAYLARKYWTWKRATMKILMRLDCLYGTDMAKRAVSNLAEVDDEMVILGEAELAFVKDDYVKAEQLYIKAIETDKLLDKYLVHSFNRLAQISISNSDYIAAYKYCEAAKTITPANPDIKLVEATLLAAEEKYVEALELLSPVVEKWNDLKYESTCGIDLEKHILLMGDVLYLMGDLENSVQVYESVLKLNNYSPEACYGMGMCYKAGELWEDAKKMFGWAIKYNPDYAEAIKELNEIEDK